MKIIEDAVLAKMNLQRLKAHRTSVLAHISKEFYETVDGVRKLKDDVDESVFNNFITYRNVVNKYYNAARTAVKVK